MKKILDQKGTRLLFLICWVAYFCSYLGRLNYSSVMAVLIDNQLTKAQAGWINTAFLATYAAGQLINGILTEKFPPAAMVFTGVIGGGLTNIAFAFADGFSSMFFLRMLTGYFVSMIWPPMLCAMVRMMKKEDVVKCSVHITSSMAAGTLVSYGISAWFLQHLSWQWAFIVPGAALVVAGLLWAILFPRPSALTQVEQLPQESPAAAPGKPLPLIRLITIPALLFAVLPVALHGAIKDGVTAWVPTYICEVFNKSASFSVMVSILLPLVNLCGAYLARLVYKWAGGNVFRGSAIFFLGASLAFLLMLVLGTASLVLTLVCFTIVTSFMMGTNVLLISLLPLEFDRYGRSATLSGGLNALAYAGSALVSGLIGVLSSAWGWQATVVSWFVMMAIGFGVCLFARKASSLLKEDRLSSPRAA